LRPYVLLEWPAMLRKVETETKNNGYPPTPAEPRFEPNLEEITDEYGHRHRPTAVPAT
jgi:hypothetical protein